ncbi:MAG: RecQ family ATP-dependent DNA helicase [Flavobacteriia bacterium]
MQEKSKEILLKYWGYDDFRASQWPIIADSLNGNDVLAMLPTGGGKSICFQVPGLALGSLTLVISPLISLMEDQVRNLKSRGIRACAISSTLTYREIDILLNNAVFGAYDFLYLSPERIQTPIFKERLKKMPVKLLVVDEAHCISEWGHDFRPAYKNIHIVRETLPDLPILALTATATSEVVDDIVLQLKLKNPKIHRGDFQRKNLSYEIIRSGNKLGSILAYCNGKGHMTGIVYCRTRKAVKSLTKVFISSKLNAAPYHGGMSHQERSQALTGWMNGTYSLMIATNAFGMGIDKPNVRFVLHYDFPENLEAYTQEAGRAGRDGLEARTIAFIEENDATDLQVEFEKKFPPQDAIKKIYHALLGYLRIAVGSGLDENYPIDLPAFSKMYQLDPLEVYHALKILEMNQTLQFIEATHTPDKVQFLVSGITLYNFQIAQPNMHSLIHFMQRNCLVEEGQFFTIVPSSLASKLKMTESAVNEQLRHLLQNGIIDWIPKSNLPSITFLTERRPDDYFQLSYEVYQKRKDTGQRKLDAVLNYLSSNECRSQFLLSYFGQTSEPCNKCDYCKRQKLDLQSIETFILDALISPLNFSELQERIPLPKDDLKWAIREMQLEQKIQLIDGKYYR